MSAVLGAFATDTQLLQIMFCFYLQLHCHTENAMDFAVASCEEIC